MHVQQPRELRKKRNKSNKEPVWSSSTGAAPPFAINKKGVPPGAWGGDFLQILRPEQPLAPIREAHVHHHVLLSPVATHHLAEQAPSLRYPVAVAHPHSHAHAYVLRLHGWWTHTLGGGPEAVFGRRDKDGRLRKGSVCTKRRVVWGMVR